MGALEHTIGLGDLLVDSWQRIAPRPAAALRGGEILLELHAADLLVAILRARVTSHAGDGCGAQSKNRHATVAANAACRRGGRRLVIGAQVLAFPNESGPEKPLRAGPWTLVIMPGQA